MNQRKYNSLLKSLFLINRVRQSDLDEVSKFGKTEKDRLLKLHLIKKMYDRKDDAEKDNLTPPNFNLNDEHEFDENEFDENSLPPDLPEEFLRQLFMSDEEYQRLSELIGDAINEVENEKNLDNPLNSSDFRVFTKEPSFEDLINWFKKLLLANNGELQITLTPGNELILIFKDFVKPEMDSKNGTPDKEEKPKRKRSQRRKKGPSSEQDDQ